MVKDSNDVAFFIEKDEITIKEQFLTSFVQFYDMIFIRST